MKWAEHVVQMGAKRRASRILVGKPVGKKPLGIPTSGWVDNIKMDVRRGGWGDID
jgi:hypothetical protein